MDKPNCKCKKCGESFLHTGFDGCEQCPNCGSNAVEDLNLQDHLKMTQDRHNECLVLGGNPDDGM